MEFRIADTFTASLARLTGYEHKAVKTTALDLQRNRLFWGRLAQPRSGRARRFTLYVPARTKTPYHRFGVTMAQMSVRSTYALDE